MDYVHVVILFPHGDNAIAFFQYYFFCGGHEEQKVHQGHTATLKQSLQNRKQKRVNRKEWAGKREQKRMNREQKRENSEGLDDYGYVNISWNHGEWDQKD